MFSDLGTYKPGEWNVYSEIKRKLVEGNGVPANEIRLIQEAKNELQEVVSGTWKKESRLSELKTEFAAIDRKIQLSTAPENKEQSETVTTNGSQLNEKLPARLKAN